MPQYRRQLWKVFFFKAICNCVSRRTRRATSLLRFDSLLWLCVAEVSAIAALRIAHWKIWKHCVIAYCALRKQSCGIVCCGPEKHAALPTSAYTSVLQYTCTICLKYLCFISANTSFLPTYYTNVLPCMRVPLYWICTTCFLPLYYHCTTSLLSLHCPCTSSVLHHYNYITYALPLY